MRIVFMGSPPFATPILERLLQSDDHTVLGLVTPPDRPRGRGREVVRSELAVLADQAGLPVLQPRSTKDQEFVDALAALGADALAIASYGEILRTNILEMCPHGALNVHGSLLPRWRGASPIQRAIAAGDAETGVSIQRMVLALDAGDVILEKRTPIGPDETAADLFDRLSVLGADVLIDALDQLDAGTATFTPQDPDGVTLAPKLKKHDGRIDFTRPADEVARHVRAMTTWPGARTTLPDGRDLVVLKAVPVSDPASDPASSTAQKATPGELMHTSELIVAAGEDTSVQLVTVKPAGKGAMDGAAFLRGAKLELGSKFA